MIFFFLVLFRALIMNLFVIRWLYTYFFNYAILFFFLIGLILSIIFFKNKTKNEKELEAVIQKILTNANQ